MLFDHETFEISLNNYKKNNIYIYNCDLKDLFVKFL